MNYLNEFKLAFNFEYKYIYLIIASVFTILILNLVRYIGIKLLSKLKDEKKEYFYIQRLKLSITIIKIIILILIWSPYLYKIYALLTVMSAAFTIALRDLIFNFFSGIYIKIAKPFVVEDRIEINNYKGDVININTLNFEVLEVNNEDFIGQSTGVITHIPNSNIFSYPLRNYNKGFKYIWNEITIKVPLDYDSKKAKSCIYEIVNKNDIIKTIPSKLKKQIKNMKNNYRIYYNNYEPTIYTKVMGNYVEYTARYLVHPKKARYVNSSIWTHILEANNKGDIKLYIENE